MSHPLPSLLLVDDDPISRDVMALLLEMQGFPVRVAEDGEVALAMLATATPDVVLVDTQMPGISGLELFAAMRNTTRARIIAISGSDPGSEIRAGADGFLLKPVQPEDLVRLLATTATEPLRADVDLNLSRESEAMVASPDAVSEEELIESGVLRKLKALMPVRALHEIYAAVATDLRDRLPKLKTAMEAGNSAEVARIGHAIKGGCSMVGLTGAAEVAARLESSDFPETWPAELQRFSATLTALEGILGKDFPG